MTSNTDPEGDKKAHKQILACTIFNTAVPVLMTATGCLNAWVLLPFMASQYKAFVATARFKSEKGSAKAAK